MLLEWSSYTGFSLLDFLLVRLDLLSLVEIFLLLLNQSSSLSETKGTTLIFAFTSMP